MIGREKLLESAAMIALAPAAIGAASADANVENVPFGSLDYPKNVIAYNPYGFHEELADKLPVASGDPEKLQEENCQDMVLNSLRKYSFRTSKDGKRVNAGIKMDSVEECSTTTDRTVDVHFDMERWAARDMVGPDGKPVKEKGLDPNSNVKVFNTESSINTNKLMKLNHRYRNTISGEKRNIQIVVGINARNKNTNEIYRKSYVLPLISKK